MEPLEAFELKGKRKEFREKLEMEDYYVFSDGYIKSHRWGERDEQVSVGRILDTHPDCHPYYLIIFADNPTDRYYSKVARSRLRQIANDFVV